MARHAARTIRAATAVLASIAAGHVVVPVAAAELGTTVIDVRIDQGMAFIELHVDAEVLLARLDRRAGRPRPPQPAAREYLARVNAHRDGILRHFLVQFDDRVGVVRVDRVAALAASGEDIAVADAQRVAIRLTADVPQGAQALSLSYALAFASYPLTVRQGTTVQSVVVDGAALAGPIPLVRPVDVWNVADAAWVTSLSGVLLALALWRFRERWTTCRQPRLPDSPPRRVA
jgi:hypothetical protein